METETRVPVNRLPIRICNDERRVITRLFAFDELHRLQRIIDQVRVLSEREAKRTLATVLQEFAGRHEDIGETFLEHFERVCELTGYADGLSEVYRLLIGSYFTMEYSLESVALFNPSIVMHPDQSGLAQGELRFLMSLRATGEGHISSTVFRTGVIGANGEVTVSPPTLYPRATQLAPDQVYLKYLFRRSLAEMSVRMGVVDRVLGPLPGEFSFDQLQQRIMEIQFEQHGSQLLDPETIQAMLWLARSNYRLALDEDADISELIIFPHAESENRGIEDLRLVRFFEDTGEAMYYGTYTAFNGHRILPMMLETTDFRTLSIHTINGAHARNKGFAMFPRRVNGHYAMCSRVDGHNLFMMYSDMPTFWESATLFAEPQYPWEYMLIGNCGSPIETNEGWLLLTHGVGPMRRYCIGAMLLDLDEPTRVIGRLERPLIAPLENEREGYTPNTVYSCGALVHNGRLVLPYAVSDRASTLATIPLEPLLDVLKGDTVL